MKEIFTPLTDRKGSGPVAGQGHYLWLSSVVSLFGNRARTPSGLLEVVSLFVNRTGTPCLSVATGPERLCPARSSVSVWPQDRYPSGLLEVGSLFGDRTGRGFGLSNHLR
jgi:hypothetical protein